MPKVISYSTRVYRALTWARFHVILKNEMDAVNRVRDLSDDLETRIRYDLALETGFQRSRPRNLRDYARAWINRKVRAPLIDFARESRLIVISEALDASRQTKAAVRAAVLGKKIKYSLFEGAEKDEVPSKGDYDYEDLIPWEDVPEDTYAEVATAEFLGTDLEAWEKTLSKKALPEMAAQFQQAMAAGESMDQVARRLGAVLGIPRNSARKMARTAIQAAANRMSDKVLKANEDLIKGYQFTATLDYNTCPICGGLDNKYYPKGKPRPGIPVHIQCRCFYTPVMKSARGLGLGPLELPKGERESMNGRVPETLKFKDWFAQPEVQAEYKKWKRQQYEKAKRRAKRRKAALARAG